MQKLIPRDGHKMITSQVMKKIATDANLPLDMIEKDYVLGWMLYGISQSSIANKIIFKGGTALSKIYFPMNWRLSEDLDFSVIKKNQNWEEFILEIKENLPKIVSSKSDIPIKGSKGPFTNEGYLQSRLQYRGPIDGGRIKIEITSEEEEVGPTHMISIPKIPEEYDYPDFQINAYTLENIFAEKLRSIIQRGKIRDYYDVWRLLNKGEKPNVELFLKKCETEKIKYAGIDQFFPNEQIESLPKFLPSITKMTNGEIDLEIILSELRESLEKIRGL